MKKIGIIQPGRLGDIIICLPIARYYYDQGYQVYWPVFQNYYNDLNEVVEYVKFIPVTNDVYRCVEHAKATLSFIKDIKIFDIAATFPGSTSTQEYVAVGDGKGDETFDMFKYRICEVPFEQKWNLMFNRNTEDEDLIYNKYVTTDKYNIVNLLHSKGKENFKIQSKYPSIEVNTDHNFFSWLKVLENANNIVLVDSAMSNLVEQCNLNNKKTLIIKPNQPLPYFKNEWNKCQT